MTHIVIVGGGFGGVYASKYLLRHKRKGIKVTLINDTNYFLFTPMLHEVASGNLSREDVALPIRDMFSKKYFDFIKGKVSSVDFTQKHIIVEGKELCYDHIVLALGSSTNFFNITDTKRCLELKNINDAVSIRNSMIQTLEQAVLNTRVHQKPAPINIVVVGAGPTGVELSAEISEFICQVRKDYNIPTQEYAVHLLQSQKEILPQLASKPMCQHKARQELLKKNIAVRTTARVTKVRKDSVEVNGNETVPADMIIWTAGVKPNGIKASHAITSERGYVLIDEFLAIKGVNNAYAIGDCALSINPGSTSQNPPTAQLTTRQAKTLAKNILAAIDNKPAKKEAFVFTPQGFLVSVGKKYAVADLKFIAFHGFFAWWLWRTIYLSKLIGKKNKLRVMIDWTINLFSKRDTSQI